MAEPIALVGTILNPDGTGATGYLKLTLNTYGSLQPAAGGYKGVLPNDPAQFRVLNGVLQDNPHIIANSDMAGNTYYIAQFLTDTGQILFSENWYINPDASGQCNVGSIVGIASADLPAILGLSLEALQNSVVLPSNIQHEDFIWGGVDSGGANSYVITQSPVPSIEAGSIAVFVASHGCTGASTLTIGGVTGGMDTLPIRTSSGGDLGPGSIIDGEVVVLRCDGGVWQKQGVTLRHNGIPNSSQQILNLVQGTGLILTDLGAGSLQLSLSSTGGTSSAGVDSFNERTGPVAPMTGDYSFAEISGIAAPAQLPKATGGSIGGVRPGSGLTVDSDGYLAVTGAGISLVAGANIALTSSGSSIIITAVPGGITGLQGDVIAGGSGLVTAKLSHTGVASGSYTNPNITIGADGRIYSISSAVSSSGSGGTGGSVTNIVLTGGTIEGIGASSGTVEFMSAFGITIDGASSVPSTGSWGFIQVPYPATITGWTVLADQPGSAVVQVKKCTFAQFPTNSDITGGSPPTLSGTQAAQNSSLPWVTAVAGGDIFEFLLTSVSSVTRLTVTIQALRALALP